ncbi:hypothetical protein RKE25_22220 (plasmid) [Dyella sp. BiH032]|uniref:hypothetical protein n=1 Tax=Dyella sp. BiH032 TaxID=3075430 RepID=UPI0028937E99|nr:hypothetical protein [Dyella sp. BiH032]WNL48448.1 hypothetical protein RKE25_22220 [Dyella sp. BiH032]
MSLTPTYRSGRELQVTAPGGSTFTLAEIRVLGWQGNCRSILRYSVGLRTPTIDQKVVDIRKVPALRGVTDGMPYRTKERLHHIAEAVLLAIGHGVDAITAMAQVADPFEEGERMHAPAFDGAAQATEGYERWIFASSASGHSPMTSQAL